MEINILSFQDCASLVAANPPFGLPMGPAMHRSFIVHEIAHAIAHMNFQISDPPVAVQEYIAYTVQLSTMEARLRQLILNRYALPPFADESEITPMYLAFDPPSFAVKAYRHAVQLVDAAAYYRQLLRGEIRFPGTGLW